MATQLGRKRPQDTATSIAQLRQTAVSLEVLDARRAEWLYERDALIRDLHERGFSEREIASIAGLTGPRVHQIITKEKA